MMVMISAFVSSAVNRGLEFQSCQFKEHKIGICCFSASHTETAYHSGAPELPSFQWGSCCSIFVMFCRSLLVLFLLAIVLSVLLSFGHCIVCSSVFWPLYCLFFCLLAIVLLVLLRFTASGYPICIFNLFLTHHCMMNVINTW